MLRLRRTSLVLAAVAFVALAVVPLHASAAIVPVTPAPNVVVLRSAPVFSWTLDGDSTAASLQVAASPNIDAATGMLVAPVINQSLSSTATSFTPGTALQLFAGHWNWRVGGTTGGVADGTAPQPFVIKPQVAVPQLSIAATHKGTSGVVKLRTNVAAYRMRVRIVHGSATCLDKVVTGKRLRTHIATWDSFRIYCYPYLGVTSGTHVKVVITISGNGTSRSVTRVTTVA